MAALGGEPPGADDRLREMLHRRARAVASRPSRLGRSRASNWRIWALARLVAIGEAARRRPAPRRWPLVAGLGLTLLLVSVLLFARTRETEIELDLDLSEASFVSSQLQTLADATGIAALGVSGLRELRSRGPAIWRRRP